MDALSGLDFERASDFLFSCWKERTPGTAPVSVFLLGPPGIGKSTIAADVVARMKAAGREDAQFHLLDLTSRLPEDIGGLPFRDGPVTRYAPLPWVLDIAKPGACGVILFDDLPAAPGAIATAVRQVVLDRRVHDHILSPDVLIIVTGNRQEDLSGASTLPAHFRNSVCIVEVHPDLDKWTRWFLDAGGDPTIPSFLRSRPANFSTLPKAADTRGRFATPRSWTLLSQTLRPARAAGCVQEAIAGLVGEGVGAEFKAFLDVVQHLPDVEAVLRDPRAAVPSPTTTLALPDQRLALTTALGFHVAKAVRTRAGLLSHRETPGRDEVTIELMCSFYRALRWVAGDALEYAASALVAYGVAGGPGDPVAMARQRFPVESEVGAMLTSIRVARSGG